MIPDLACLAEGTTGSSFGSSFTSSTGGGGTPGFLVVSLDVFARRLFGTQFGVHAIEDLIGIRIPWISSPTQHGVSLLLHMGMVIRTEVIVPVLGRVVGHVLRHVAATEPPALPGARQVSVTTRPTCIAARLAGSLWNPFNLFHEFKRLVPTPVGLIHDNRVRGQLGVIALRTDRLHHRTPMPTM